MKGSLLIGFIFCLLSCAESQNRQSQQIGGPCQGCEAVYEYGTQSLQAIDTLPKFKELPNPIYISGTVYQKDGQTPAPDVILYIYHTNNEGKYPSTAQSKGWERQHGYLRGWLKTDANGNYGFYTSRPASYPNSSLPQHIHITVKEPDKGEYYIEDFYFESDPNLPSSFKTREHPRGGSGVISLRNENGLQTAKRDIILGLNIPNYPSE